MGGIDLTILHHHHHHYDHHPLHHHHHHHHHHRHIGKPVVIATQMMESMIENPTPTRAEASDCATAIYDSSDAVMLSAESAAGKYPIESVLMQQQIINRVETDEVFRAGLDRFAKEFDVLQSKDSTTLAITLAARQVIHHHHHYLSIIIIYLSIVITYLSIIITYLSIIIFYLPIIITYLSIIIIIYPSSSPIFHRLLTSRNQKLLSPSPSVVELLYAWLS